MSTELYIDYHSTTTEVRAPDPDDPWDNGDTTGDYEVVGVRLTQGYRDKFTSDEEIVEGDVVHVVYVAYDSGSTFGTDGGYGEIIAMTKSEELSLEALMYTEAMVSSGRYYINKGDKRSVVWPDGLGPERTYYSCIGYFEHNQRPRLERFVVAR